jgi:hypothetical protein
MYSVLGLRARLHHRIGLMGEDSDGGERGPVVDPNMLSASRFLGSFQNTDENRESEKYMLFLIWVLGL